MAWQEVERQLKPCISNPVNLGIGKLGFVLSLRQSALGALGWKQDDRLKLYVDGDANKLKLAVYNTGLYVPRLSPKGGALVILGAISGYRAEPTKRGAINHAFEGSSIVFDIPAGWKIGRPEIQARPQTPPEQSVIKSAIRNNSDARVGEVPRAASLAQLERKVSVNDKFFNDPKPKVAMASGLRGERS